MKYMLRDGRFFDNLRCSEMFGIEMGVLPDKDLRDPARPPLDQPSGL